MPVKRDHRKLSVAMVLTSISLDTDRTDVGLQRVVKDQP